MHVVATAGHVDHGKSTLVQALTGSDPDRYAEEKRRGLTIDLGFAWTDVGGEQVAFVDVPGHERFVTTMLAGVGPVPAVLLVVAADGGWMPQSQEHLDALDALGVSHGLLVVTRSDLAEPGLAEAEARAHLKGTSLEGVQAVAVSALTGDGLDRLRDALARLVRSLPQPSPDAPVRLWVDRVFTVRGAGTVVTGTLPAGMLRVADRFQLPGRREVAVRAVQSLGRSVHEIAGVARVAVNLRGVSTDEVSRGDALITPGTCVETTVLDVRLSALGAELPSECVLHIGSAHVAARLRPLGPAAVRLRLRAPLPLRIGDVALLRDPGRRQVLSGLTVLDVDPPALDRRGAARMRAADLAQLSPRPDAAAELRRRRVARRSRLVAMGVPDVDVDALARDKVRSDGDWLLDGDHADALAGKLRELVEEHRRLHPLEVGLPLEVARQRLGLPTRELVVRLVTAPLRVEDGVVLDGGGGDGFAGLPGPVADGVERLRQQLADAPYVAPDAGRLRDLGLGRRELAAAVRVGALLEVGDGVYLTPEAVSDADVPLRDLPQPFTLSQAREAWGTTRRVAVPLLQYLDWQGITDRLPDDRRRLREGGGPTPPP
ncbi:MAG: selenocysteine-specific translation elongation factor [Actinomycetes bacterium]